MKLINSIVLLLVLSGSLFAQPPRRFKLKADRPVKKEIVLLFQTPDRFDVSRLYFGEKNEIATHLFTHFAIGLWRVDFSIVAAIAIEASDTINGKFEIKDWLSRIGGALYAYLFKKFIADV